MTKLTLDMAAFKALASDTRLDILKVLDGKKMALKDISKATKLNKATLHEHLSKLNEAGLVKKNEREGHKWVYYKLTWKGECLLHPENTRIVVLFSITFFTLFVGIMNLVSYAKGAIVGRAVNYIGKDLTAVYAVEDSSSELFLLGRGANPTFTQAPIDYVPLTNQTVNQLSQSLTDNAGIKGVLGNTIDSYDMSWAAEEVTFGATTKSETLLNAPSEVVTDGGRLITTGSNGGDASSSMLAIVHDPALQQIAIACIVIFSLLICFSAWRLWKSRSQKL